VPRCHLPAQRACLVELTFTVNRDFTASQIAATILHEAMHARLHSLGFPLEMADRARQERFCRRAEIEFGRAVPDGAPIVERALATLEGRTRLSLPTLTRPWLPAGLRRRTWKLWRRRRGSNASSLAARARPLGSERREAHADQGTLRLVPSAKPGLAALPGLPDAGAGAPVAGADGHG
jgi:hypothetical protein